MATIAETFALAWQQYQAGNTGQAEFLYRQILQTDPSHVDARCLLGATCQAQGKIAEAEANYRRAIELWPGHGVACNGLGILMAEQGRLDEAAVCFEQILDTQPRNADAHNNLGLVRARQGRLDEAESCYRRALELRPRDAATQANLNGILAQKATQPQRPAPRVVAVNPNQAASAQAYLQQGLALNQQARYDEAKVHFEQALQLQPDLAEARTNLAHALVRQEKYDEAIANYRQALRAKPDDFEAHYILAVALVEKGNLDEAVTHFEEAIHLRPQFADAYNNLGSALLNQGRLDEAVIRCEEAARLKPDFAEAYSNLGCIYLKRAQLRESKAMLEKALRCQPNLAPARSNMLFCMNYDPEADPAVVFAEHCHWGRLHSPAAPPPPHTNDPTPDRRLRIGYISPDFRHHALARYFEPVLAHHNPELVETFLYAEVPVPDSMTAHLEKLAHSWFSTYRLTDEKVAQRIRDDRIDILVDLAGHSAGNRLLTLALKPAPVQVTWLGYMNTTGLKAVDYRLTDEVLDPLNHPVRDSEQLVRLPNGFCCFGAGADTPAVAPLPALAKGQITFGSLNNSFKLNDRVYDLWAKVLQAVPGSRLLMFRDTLTATVRESLRGQFADRGIAPERLDLRQWSGAPGYLRVYDEIDVSLDAFPCTGGVTTCESLWMGVPVLTLCGVRPAGRHSATLLTRVGLTEWVARTPVEYVAKAAEQTQMLDRLAQVRAELRDRMTATVCDAKRFTGELEEAYRGMWRRWCERKKI